MQLALPACKLCDEAAEKFFDELRRKTCPSKIQMAIQSERKTRRRAHWELSYGWYHAYRV